MVFFYILLHVGVVIVKYIMTQHIISYVVVEVGSGSASGLKMSSKTSELKESLLSLAHDCLSFYHVAVLLVSRTVFISWLEPLSAASSHPVTDHTFELSVSYR